MDHFCACVGVTFEITPVVLGAHQVMSVVFSFVGEKRNSRTEMVTIQVVIFQGSRFGVRNCSEMIRPWKQLHIHTQI